MQLRYPAIRWKAERKRMLEKRFGDTYNDCLSGWSAAAKEFLRKYQAVERLIVDTPFTASEYVLELRDWRIRNAISVLRCIEENELYEWTEVR